MGAVFRLLGEHAGEFLHGLLTTLKLCGYIWVLGLAGGTLLGVAASRWRRAVGIVARLLFFALSAIPVLVFLFWLHYPFQVAIGIVLDPFITAVVALSIVNAVFVADAVMRALVDFPRQYVLAAQVCGMSRKCILRHIQVPLTLRQLIPAILLIEIGMLQATLFASLISVDEIFRACQRVNSVVYRPVEIYTALALLFLVVCAPLHAVAHWLRAKYTQDMSEG